MSPRMIRWLALAALVLPAVMVLAPVQAQPGRMGGMGGRPGGQPGMPGGIQGGMVGQPQGIAGGIGGGGGMGGGGGIHDEWVCTACGSVIGHGPIKPAWSRCPTCGARLVDDPGGLDSGPPANSPTPGSFNPSPQSKSNSPTDSGSSNSGRTVVVAVVIGVGVLAVFAVVGLIFYFNISRNAQRKGSRRRKRVIHDD